MSFLLETLRGLSELIWPRTCHICGSPLPAHSKYLCDACITTLPYISTGIKSPMLTEIENRLISLPQFVKGASYIYYTKGLPSVDLLHDIKYHGHSRMAKWLGEQMAWSMLPTGLFNDVEALVPIPLSIARQLKRGYNQSDMLAKGVSNVTKIPVIYPLTAKRHKSQTRLSREDRLNNIAGIFKADKSHPLFNPANNPIRHIMLIDDVCTTGTTLLHAAQALTQQRDNLRISVLTLALTNND